MSAGFERRRALLQGLAALGTAGLAALPSAWAAPPPAVPRSEATGLHYDPAGHFDLDVFELQMRRNRAGRMLLARVYQPTGPGPFPSVLDLHGGAWNTKDRHAEEPMDRALAASGVLVVAIDLTLAPEAAYPACIEDAHYGVRWLKLKSPVWRGDPSRVGIYGSSSGGHVAELLAMRPHDPDYGSIALAEAPQLDATVSYVAMRSPISDPFARFQNAERLKRT